MWQLREEHFAHAARVTKDFVVRTPLDRVDALGVWVKRETRQHTGSFKVRGALSKLASLDAGERARGVVAASAGNHGLGVAWAGKTLGIDVRVVVPHTSPDVKRNGIRALGADLLVCGDCYDASEDVARGVEKADGRVFVSPYDDPFVAAGNGGTLADEILDAVHDVATVVVPLGGGGLAIGMATRLRMRGSRAVVIGVQSEASPAMVLSLARGAAITRYVGAPTLAEGLEGGVSETAYAHVRDLGLEVVSVSEPAIADALTRAPEWVGERIEGSAAVGLALAQTRTFAAPAVIVLTGRNAHA